MFPNFSLSAYQRNWVRFFGSLIFSALIFLRISEATKYEFDGCEMPDNSPGVCRIFQDCSTLIEILKKGDISLQDPISCGYKGAFELICCPTEKAVVTRTTTPLIFDGSTDVKDYTTKKPVEFWEPLLTTTTTTPLVTTKPDFWLHLLNSSTSSTETTPTTSKPDFWLHLLSSTTTTTATTTTTTTTPKPLVLGDQELDKDSKFYDFSKLLKDDANDQAIAAGNGQNLLVNVPQSVPENKLANGFVNRPHNGFENVPTGNVPFGGFVNGPQSALGNAPLTPANGPVGGFVNVPQIVTGNAPLSENRVVNGFVNGPQNTFGIVPLTPSVNGPVGGFINGPPNTLGSGSPAPSVFVKESSIGPVAGPLNPFGNNRLQNGLVNGVDSIDRNGLPIISDNSIGNEFGNGQQIAPAKNFANGFGTVPQFSSGNGFNSRPSNGIDGGLVGNRLIGGFPNGNQNDNLAGNGFEIGRTGNGRVIGRGRGRRLGISFYKDRGNEFGLNNGQGNDRTVGLGHGNILRNVKERVHNVLKRGRNGGDVVMESANGLDYTNNNNRIFGNSIAVPENRPQYPDQFFTPNTQILQTIHPNLGQHDQVYITQPTPQYPYNVIAVDRKNHQSPDFSLIQSPNTQGLQTNHADFLWPDQFQALQSNDNQVRVTSHGHTHTSSSTTTTTTTTPDINPAVRSERPAIEACRNIEHNLKPYLTPHILDGTPVEPGEYPHMAAIGYSAIGNDGGPYDFRCGGTLIHEKFILTAAHCVNSRDATPAIVRLGMADFDNADEIPNRVEIPIKTVHIPDSYSSRRKYNDIALLELETEVDFSDYIYPACLYTEPDDPPKNSKLYVTGWGTVNVTTRQKSNILLKARLEIEPLDQCQNSYLEYGPTRQLDRGLLRTQLCARDPGNTKDACQGDSGGPLNLIVDESTKNFRIVGVISTGFGCAASTPGLYTRVSAFLDYIENIVWPSK